MKLELDYLRVTKRKEITEYMYQVMDGEDPAENGVYLAAKNEQAIVESRIRALETLLNRVEIIQTGELAGEVRLGSRVTIQEDGLPFETYTIVGSAEADVRDRLISNESPMGSALLGRHVGEFVEVVAPDGRYQISIISIG